MSLKLLVLHSVHATKGAVTRISSGRSSVLGAVVGTTVFVLMLRILSHHAGSTRASSPEVPPADVSHYKPALARMPSTTVLYLLACLTKCLH